MLDLADRLRRMIMKGAALTSLDAVARPWLGGVGAVLMLHRVTAAPRWPGGFNAGLTVTPDFLDAAIGALKADGFAFVSMDEALEHLHRGGTGRFATLTADDGYRDNFFEALPVLESHRAPLTVFIAPALIDRTVPLWWEAAEDIIGQGRPLRLPGTVLPCDTSPKRHAAFLRLHEFFTREIPENTHASAISDLAAQVGVDPFESGNAILMDWDELKRFSQHPLVTVGAHTVNHVALRRLEHDAARAEMAGSRDRLAAELGSTPRHFAYPYGWAAAAGPREAALAAELGFASAVTTRHGVIHRQHAGHTFALPRLSLNGRFQNLRDTKVMARGFTAPIANKGRVLVTV